MRGPTCSPSGVSSSSWICWIGSANSSSPQFCEAIRRPESRSQPRLVSIWLAATARRTSLRAIWSALRSSSMGMAILRDGQHCGGEPCSQGKAGAGDYDDVQRPDAGECAGSTGGDGSGTRFRMAIDFFRVAADWADCNAGPDFPGAAAGTGGGAAEARIPHPAEPESAAGAGVVDTELGLAVYGVHLYCAFADGGNACARACGGVDPGALWSGNHDWRSRGRTSGRLAADDDGCRGIHSGDADPAGDAADDAVCRSDGDMRSGLGHVSLWSVCSAAGPNC